MFNLFSTFNFAALNQVNTQRANNIAVGSAGAVQVVSQNAANNAQIIQGR
jgi:hypothetical protein